MKRKLVQWKRQPRIEALNKRKLEAEVDIIAFQRGLGKKLTVWGFLVTLAALIISTAISLAPLGHSSKNDSIRLDSLETEVGWLKMTIQKLDSTRENKVMLDSARGNGSN
jgi:hypothetical protein